MTYNMAQSGHSMSAMRGYSDVTTTQRERRQLRLETRNKSKSTHRRAKSLLEPSEHHWTSPMPCVTSHVMSNVGLPDDQEKSVAERLSETFLPNDGGSSQDSASSPNHHSFLPNTSQNILPSKSERQALPSPQPAAKRRLRLSRHLWMTFAVVLVALVSPALGNVPPRFLLDGQSEIVLRLREGDQTPVGSVIYRLRGYDPDGDRLQFAIRGQVGSRLLEIRPATDTEADLVLRRPLDRELEDEYSIVLTLTDGRLGEAVVTQSLLILVEDVNDNMPVFLPHEPTLTVREDSQPRVLAVLQATDRDEGPFGQVVYRLEADSSAARDLFSVTTREGRAVLKLDGKLDYERQPFYQLQVLAVDRAATNAHTATAALVVRVEDVADSPPEFVVVPPVTRISEDLAVGTQIMKVLAIDGDRAVNAPIEYAMFGGGAIFSIDADSGAIYVAGPLDRERKIETNGAYILPIGAREAGSSTDHVTTEATIILTDVNDETPTFSSATYTAEVSEAAQRHLPLTFVGSAAPQVYDYDQGTNGTFRLYLEGDGGAFEVTPPEGVNEATLTLRVRDPAGIDFETARELNFTIVAEEVTDIDPKSSRATVTVYVRDANDNVPEFAEKRYVVSVPENVRRGTMIAWMQALDPDSGSFGTEGVRYTDLSGDIAEFLRLDTETGQITVLTDNHGLDRETTARHQLTVEARDDNGRGNRNRVPLEVIVTDVNDQTPRCLRPLLRLTVAENTAQLTQPARVEATDDDQPGEGHLPPPGPV